MTPPTATPRDFEQLYQQAPCGYLVTTDDGTITSVNDTFVHWTGHARDALLGRRLQELMPVGDQILWATHATPLLRLSGAVAEILLEVTGADGTRQAALLSAARPVPAEGHEAEVRVIVFGAHERRRYEQELVATVRGWEQSEARRASAEADLRHLALHDVLTGLPNRAGLTLRLEAALAERPRAGGLGVLFVDLDLFKAVNDSLGHAAGDELLVVVADRLRSVVRGGSTVARLSGDEFVVVADVADSHEAAGLATRVLEVLTAPVTLQGLEVVTSASIGVAVADSSDDSAEQLLRRADVAMYRAKARGRGGFELHDPAQVDPAVGRLRLLGELRAALDAGQLRLHYQPRMDLLTGQLSGVEALVRWQHPDRGLLPPSEFIDAAEASGLIRRVGTWVLEEAVSQIGRWRAAHPDAPPVEMAVNLSARQLEDPELAALVGDVLVRHRLPPELLTLEITETALMADPERALATLTELKRLGVVLAVDDFGTGYASLTYLQRFPVDELKIDRSFVGGLTGGPGDAAIVAACVQLAHAVGLRAVAEGVETEAQRVALVDLGCDLAQGYLYTRPLPPDDLLRWLRQRARAAPDPVAVAGVSSSSPAPARAG